MEMMVNKIDNSIVSENIYNEITGNVQEWLDEQELVIVDLLDPITGYTDIAGQDPEPIYRVLTANEITLVQGRDAIIESESLLDLTSDIVQEYKEQKELSIPTTITEVKYHEILGMRESARKTIGKNKFLNEDSERNRTINKFFEVIGFDINAFTPENKVIFDEWIATGTPGTITGEGEKVIDSHGLYAALELSAPAKDMATVINAFLNADIRYDYLTDIFVVK